MSRILLHMLLPFLAPFLLFALWRLLVARGSRLLVSTPWYGLAVAGLVLASAGLVVLALTGGDAPGRYVPPRLKGDRVLPAIVEQVEREPR